MVDAAKEAWREHRAKHYGTLFPDARADFMAGRASLADRVESLAAENATLRWCIDDLARTKRELRSHLSEVRDERDTLQAKLDLIHALAVAASHLDEDWMQVERDVLQAKLDAVRLWAESNQFVPKKLAHGYALAQSELAAILDGDGNR